MKLYTVQVFGWMTIIEAVDKREAVRVAKGLAPGASLLPSDVNSSHVHRSTQDEIDWHRAMTGGNA